MLQNHSFEIFGINVFNEKAMAKHLPHPIFKRWQSAYRNEGALDREGADAIAHAMKEWAMAKGVTHYSHFFHPMHGTTAEKHVSFLEFDNDNQPIARFNGKSLIKGEGDASSFPSGGLRATFEARGYTYWDLTSPAFIIDNVLHIPTVFVSYNGEALDKKLPLLKSMQAISLQATRVCNILKDKDVKSVKPVIGLEQEYFLIDKKTYLERYDLLHTGRTLFGMTPPKSQELNDHYYGNIPERVRNFMKEVNTELWKVGIYAQAEHNEVAPCQFEVAPIYCDTNLATDQNQLMMTILKKVALKHDFACLLHEKPFAGVNGSGKHNNYSLITDDGQNLFEPGERPYENIRFLVMVCAVIKAVEQHAPLLRMASSTVNNDYRLGASEAPPAIISICMGNYLEELLLKIRDGEQITPANFENNVHLSSLADIPTDTSDRNRTSPFAFTGNKFEFRMLGSSRSAAPTNTILNTIVADVLQEVADRLEQFKYIQDIREEALVICQDIIKQHANILFSGDGYHPNWLVEASERNLPNIPKYVDSIESLISKESIEVFTKHHIFSEAELYSRVTNNYVQYNRQITLEGRSLRYISAHIIQPALLQELQTYQLLITPNFTNPLIMKKVEELYNLYAELETETNNLQAILVHGKTLNDAKEFALYNKEYLLKQLDILKDLINKFENICSKANYPLPTFDEIFHSLY